MSKNPSGEGVAGFVQSRLGWRAWIIPVGLVISVLLGFAAAAATGKTYGMSKQVIFLSPPIDGTDARTLNPFLAFTGSLNTAASVVALAVTDGRTSDRLAPKGSGISYEVLQPPSTATPVLDIQVSAGSEAQAAATSRELVRLIEANLRIQQAEAGAPKRTWISSSVVAADAEPSQKWTDQIAAFIVVLAIGFLITLGLTGLLIRRRKTPVRAEVDIIRRADA